MKKTPKLHYSTDSNFLNFYQLPEWYVDFDKIRQQITNYAPQIKALQKVIRAPDLKNVLLLLIQKDPLILEVLLLLIAQRWNKFVLREQWHLSSKRPPTSAQWNELFAFLEKTQLVKILRDKTIQQLFDYLFGIEVGMNTNARKNRTGVLMEAKVDKVLQTKLQNQDIVWYQTQTKVTKIFSADFPSLTSLSLAIKTKVFDFIFEKNNTIYLVEVNCYNVAGSKINETIRAYQKFNDQINQQQSRFRFIWITDGLHWFNNPQLWSKLKSSFQHLLCLREFERF